MSIEAVGFSSAGVSLLPRPSRRPVSVTVGSLPQEEPPEPASASSRPVLSLHWSELPIDDDPPAGQLLAVNRQRPHREPLLVPGATHRHPDRHVVLWRFEHPDRPRNARVPILHWPGLGRCWRSTASGPALATDRASLPELASGVLPGHLGDGPLVLGLVVGKRRLIGNRTVQRPGELGCSRTRSVGRLSGP